MDSDDRDDLSFCGDFFKAMFILLIVFIGVADVAMSIEDIFSDVPDSWNISENVTGKQISYDSKLQRNHYFIFTDNRYIWNIILISPLKTFFYFFIIHFNNYLNTSIS